jgi:hypothetical protein
MDEPHHASGGSTIPRGNYLENDQQHNILTFNNIPHNILSAHPDGPRTPTPRLRHAN